MRFFSILEDLKNEFADNCIVRQNGTILLGPGKIPRYQHMLFKPLSMELIEQNLISQYKKPFPEPYTALLLHTNGANLCTVRIRTPKFCFASNLLTAFGLPLLPTSMRVENEEPFDVRIEDLGHPSGIPSGWLKCGSYITLDDISQDKAIYIDTSTNRVYGCKRNDHVILDQWDDLDTCFCQIYNHLTERQEEYFFNP